MSLEDLIKKAAVIYDEYHPTEGLDTAIQKMLEEFLKMHVNDYLCILPSNCLGENIMIDASEDIRKGDLQVDNLQCQGGKIKLSQLNENPFLKLVSFKHGEWKRKLFYDDLIEGNSPKRRLQDSKYTCGGTSKPVICIEQENGDKILAFWGYKQEISNVSDFTYIKECDIDTLLEGDVFPEYLLIPYIYYVLSYVFQTTAEMELSQAALNKMQQMLSIHKIEAQIPVSFNTEKR